MGRVSYYESVNDVPANGWRWPHFRPEEFMSKGNGALMVHEQALDCLEMLRSTIGQQLIITSAYRDPLYNARVGGAPASRHKVGDAFDIRWPDLAKANMIVLAKNCGFRGIGIYSRFLHIDLGAQRQWSGV
tara:strand:+ start:66 stop:458 length:393 start_codon:yes stop_codon:yes gene_type:complete